MSGVAAVILAAGGSQRMGRPKQLLEINGQTLLRRAVSIADAAGCNPIIVVIGALAEAMRAELRGLKVVVVENQDWAKGIGTSLRAGFAPLEGVRAAVILLCDQPKISGASIRRLIDAQESSGKLICAAAFAGTIGPPVVVGVEKFKSVALLPDDQGAKGLWMAEPEALLALECEEAEEDIDTPAEYLRVGGTSVSTARALTKNVIHTITDKADKPPAF